MGVLSGEADSHFASFSYQAQSWSKPRRVAAKVEWHPGELYPRVGDRATAHPSPDEPTRRRLAGSCARRFDAVDAAAFLFG